MNLTDDEKDQLREYLMMVLEDDKHVQRDIREDSGYSAEEMVEVLQGQLTLVSGVKKLLEGLDGL